MATAPAPGTPLDLCLRYSEGFWQFIHRQPVDLTYCDKLEAATYKVFDEWLKGLKDGQESFEKGKRIGGVMECVIISTGSSQPAVVFLVMRLRRSIVLQIEQVAYAESVAQTVANQREAECEIGKLLVEQCFWEGVQTVLEQ